MVVVVVGGGVGRGRHLSKIWYQLCVSYFCRLVLGALIWGTLSSLIMILKLFILKLCSFAFPDPSYKKKLCNWEFRLGIDDSGWLMRGWLGAHSMVGHRISETFSCISISCSYIRSYILSSRLASPIRLLKWAYPLIRQWDGFWVMWWFWFDLQLFW